MADIVKRLRERSMDGGPNSEYLALRINSALFSEAADEIVRLRALLGNAVGAIIDSGGYCEGPHDVAAAIYRLTDERNSALADLVRLGCPPGCMCTRHITRMLTSAEARELMSAAGGAPGVSETHTDPEEAA